MFAAGNDVVVRVHTKMDEEHEGKCVGMICEDGHFMMERGGQIQISHAEDEELSSTTSTTSITSTISPTLAAISTQVEFSSNSVYI